MFGLLTKQEMLLAMVGVEAEKWQQMYRTLVGIRGVKNRKMLLAMVGKKFENVPHPGGVLQAEKDKNAPSYGGGDEDMLNL
jgi:hypothetical protein